VICSRFLLVSSSAADWGVAMVGGSEVNDESRDGG
jgi:hypothetical protein